MKDKAHVITVFSIVIACLIVAIIADKMFQPKSFDKHGHYRWDAVNELNSQAILNQSTKTCSECHKDIYKSHEKDAHYNVPCVDCHGAGNLHVSYFRKDENSKNITKEQAVLKKEFNFEGCLYCHRQLMARPSDFPQVNQKEHYKFMHVIDSNTKCIDCHNPHEPIFLMTDSRQSRLHPMVYRCSDCHKTKPKKNFYDVADHPKIFECKDCHAEIVKDFNDKPHHKNLECRTCHLFHKENETIGRMYKNGNAKFCLLCHEDKPFKDPKYPPKIEWPSHLGNAKTIEKQDTKICLDCHTKQIHTMNLSSRGNPHPGNWKADHKKYAKKVLDSKDKTMTCQNCHKKDFCMACHKTEMPHAENWAETHKNVVAKQGKKLCATCHDAYFCTICHDLK